MLLLHVLRCSDVLTDSKLQKTLQSHSSRPWFVNTLHCAGSRPKSQLPHPVASVTLLVTHFCFAPLQRSISLGSLSAMSQLSNRAWGGTPCTRWQYWVKDESSKCCSTPFAKTQLRSLQRQANTRAQRRPPLINSYGFGCVHFLVALIETTDRQTDR